MSGCIKTSQNSHRKCSASLRKLTDDLVLKIKAASCSKPIDISMFICDTCRININHPHVPAVELDHFAAEAHGSADDIQEIERVPRQVAQELSSESESDLEDVRLLYNLKTFNEGLRGINVTPISKKKIRSSRYSQRKCQQIIRGVKGQLFRLPDGDNDVMQRKARDFDEIMAQLKKKYDDPECTKSDQIKILSVLPESWTVNRVIEEFKASRYTVEQVRASKYMNNILYLLNLYIHYSGETMCL